MNDSDIKLEKLEQLDLTMNTENLRLEIEWFRSIKHHLVPNENWHSHSSIEMHFVLEGSLTLFFWDRTVEIHKGTMIIIPPNTSHRLENTSGSKYFRYILNVVMEPLNDNFETMFLFNRLLVNEPISIPIHDQIINLLKSCSIEATDQTSGFINIIQCNIQIMLISIARKLVQTRKDSNYVNEKYNYNRQRSHHIRKYIENSDIYKLTVGDIENYMHLSSKQIQRIVQSEYGFTVKQLIQHIRLKKAKVMLKNPAFSIKEIANDMQFPNEQYFSKFFKKIEGLTPSQYRNGILPDKMPNAKKTEIK